MEITLESKIFILLRRFIIISYCSCLLQSPLSRGRGIKKRHSFLRPRKQGTCDLTSLFVQETHILRNIPFPGLLFSAELSA